MRERPFKESFVTRLLAGIFVLGLLSGCASFLKMDDEIAFSGEGVLASYDQSAGEMTDLNRVDVSMNKRQLRPVELATERVNSRELALTDFKGLTVEQLKRSPRRSSAILF